MAGEHFPDQYLDEMTTYEGLTPHVFYPEHNPVIGLEGHFGCYYNSIILKFIMNIAGNAMRPAYLANVCVSNVARRCGVGELMVESARDLVRTLGMQVH